MKKIVVVDDDAGMRSLIVDILSPLYQVHQAEDGVVGLEVIRRETPDLVVLDLLMPRMHGFEVCKRLREDERLKGVKVLISSSKSYPHDIKTATDAGADKYIVKPFQVASFLNIIEEMIGGPKSDLKLRFWGTRGSIPAPGPLTQRYGGNTACTEIRLGDDILIIDAGTGLRDLGQALMREFADKPLSAKLFIGHAHWDHIQGFPFFTPAFLPRNKLTVYGVHATTQSFAETLSRQMQPPYFPITIKDMASQLQIVELSGPVTVGEARISYHYLNHPGITVGFRIEARGRSVCYLSDHEPYSKLNNKGEFSAKEDAAVAEFAKGSDLLISEAQYSDEEYKYKKSWGHSTFTDVIGLAARAQAKQLAFFHHDPTHTDEMMDRYLDECREHVQKNGLKLSCFAAQEGMTLSL